MSLNLYDSLKIVYNYMNDNLFEGQLPACVITLRKKKNALGYFHGSNFEKINEFKESVDEIALNSQYFKCRTDKQIASTLVHEMCHLWQYHYGKPSNNGYHNKEWAVKMKSIGLIPTDTGAVNGKQTGYSMTHIIEEGGIFEEALNTINFTIDCSERGQDSKMAKTKNKVKYSCPSCDTNAWGKPGMNIICGDCETNLMQLP